IVSIVTTSQRTRSLERRAKAAKKEAFDNFAAGMVEAYGVDPRLDQLTGTHVREAFTASYPLYEWCRCIRRPGNAKYFLSEVRSSLPAAIALAGLGLYEVSLILERYLVERLLCFLYFREHPRELDLVQESDAIWEQTRP